MAMIGVLTQPSKTQRRADMTEERHFNSRALSKGTYNPQTGLLRIWFTSNPHHGYDYYSVPAHIWQGLCSAASAGDYYSRHIRDSYSAKRF